MSKKSISWKLLLTAISFLFIQLGVSAQVSKANINDRPVFNGDHLIYQGRKIPLGNKAFYIDGQLSASEVAKNPYVFNSVNEAVKHLTDGKEGDPMVLYIAPYVYWIDNPDDPAIRVSKTGSSPFGLEIKCEWLRFYGLAENANNIVLASNRGQTMGAKGNFTMFNISGQGTSAENITFGNYCNIDLDYPLLPALSRKKRGSAIVQAQLVFCNGDKLVARNTRFVSRLNLCPFSGGKRVLFDRCHFESTDDALNGTAIYLNCTLDFYSGKPFWGTSGTGAIFLIVISSRLQGGSNILPKAQDRSLQSIPALKLKQPPTLAGGIYLPMSREIISTRFNSMVNLFQWEHIIPPPQLI